MARARTLMKDGRWLLALGEPVPEVQPPPVPEKPAERRSVPLPVSRATGLGLVVAGVSHYPDQPHGTKGRYDSGCRCGVCANEQQKRAAQMRAQKRQEPPKTHGTTTAYCIHRCRCDVCREAHNARARERRK
jgi:hypothetical protein